MKKEKGITLIALVITIIILLILAGITISQLIGSGLFEKAKLAKNRTKETENIENQRLSEYETQINELGGEKKEDTPGISAKDVLDSEDKSKYYGRIVNGYTCESNNDITWRLLCASNENFYLMTDECINSSIVPRGRKGTSVNEGTWGSEDLYFKDIINDYSGSMDVKSDSLKVLNSGYFTSGYSSSSNGWKAAAFLLDIEAWDSFTNLDIADFCIGGPSLDLIVEALKCFYDRNNFDSAFEANEHGYR